MKARVNQAAINYHFKGKNGLYLEVLKTAFEKLTKHAGFDPEKLKSLSREEALRVDSSQGLSEALASRIHPDRGFDQLHCSFRTGLVPD
jgi:AcrR family transcriptional regulator